MARGTTLGALITELRSEVGHSLQASLGKSTRDMLINVLQRTQKWLWNDYDWPFLKVRRDTLVANGQRYYDMPSDMVFERISHAEFKWGDRWDRLTYGIGASEYNQYDSDQSIKSWPIYRYDNYENNQFEVWPIPSDNGDTTTKSGTVRFYGTKNLSNFVSESDTADLDDHLITLFAAAEILARQKQADAQNKLAVAENHYRRLKARLSKSDPFVISEGESPDIYVPKGPPVVAIQSSS